MWPWKRQKQTSPKLDPIKTNDVLDTDEVLGVECGAFYPLDFDLTLSKLNDLSPKAQTTFSYRFIQILPIKVVKSLHYYAEKRLSYEDSQPRSNKRNIPAKAGPPLRSKS